MIVHIILIGTIVSIRSAVTNTKTCYTQSRLYSCSEGGCINPLAKLMGLDAHPMGPSPIPIYTPLDRGVCTPPDIPP